MRIRLLFPPPPLITVTREAQIPVDSGQNQRSRDAQIPVDSGQNQRDRDAQIPVDSGQPQVSRDAQIPVETTRIWIDAVIPVDSGGINPFSLAHFWNVRTLFSDSLFHTWSAQSLLYKNSLQHQWRINAGTFNDSLTHSWRVIPNLPATFSNDIQCPVATVTKTPPLTIRFKTVFIDSTVELTADHFSGEVASPTNLFTEASDTDRITIEFGLKPLGGGPDQVISHIRDGVFDEYELQVTPTSQIIRVRGRDASADVLDCEFNKTFIRANYNASGQYDDETQSQISSAGAKTITMADGSVIQIPATVFEVGVFSASRIAAQAAAKAGLTLLWQVRDYELQSTFAASGRIIDTLRKLIEPWAQVEPFRADVYMQGTTLIVRHRQLPGAPLVPGYTFDVAQMRRGEITIRKRFAQSIGALKLVGRLEQVATNFLTVINDDDETEVEVEQTTIVPPTNSDPTQKRIVTKTRYLLPQQIVTRQFKDVYAPHKVEHTETFKEYTDTEVGKLLSKSVTTTRKWDESISSLAPFERSTEYNTYDAITFLLRNQTTVFESAPGGSGIATYVASKMISKVIYDVAPNMAEEVTTEYAASSGMSGGADSAVGSAFWDIVRQDSQIQAGHRAGGSGRKTIFIPNFPGSTTNIEINTVIDADPCAPTVAYSNENLTRADLLFLQTLFQAANAYTFEFEVMFSGVAMPWLQKGIIIQITGLVGPDSVAIALPPVYVSEVRSTYDESKKEASYVTQVRAFAWQ